MHSKTLTSSYHLCWNWFLIGRFLIDQFIFPVSLLSWMSITILRNYAWLTLPVVVVISCGRLWVLFPSFYSSLEMRTRRVKNANSAIARKDGDSPFNHFQFFLLVQLPFLSTFPLCTLDIWCHVPSQWKFLASLQSEKVLKKSFQNDVNCLLRVMC